MKKILIFIIGLLIFLPTAVYAEEKVDLYLFYGDGCPHCADEKEDLLEMQEEYPQLEVHLYEIWYNEDNRDFLSEVTEELGVTVTGIPFTVIGDMSFIGYSQTRRTDFESAIEFYSNNSCPNVVNNIINDTTTEPERECLEKESKVITLPVFGDIETKDFSLPFVTMLIGIVDGFNPCAMWILLFLISMLLGMKDKKRMWILGLTFIVTSAVVYFAFMAAWLNLIMLIGTIIIIRTLIGVLGLGAGAWSIRNYFKERKNDGCHVIDKAKRKPIFEKIKKFTHEKSFVLAISGIIVLAISVNLIEMLCSLGLPAIYVELLSLNNISEAGKYFYLMLYTLFFMLDDIIIFTIAMVTLKATGISTKYSKYSHLIGGIIMIIVGLLLIVKPELLMFG